MKNNEYYIKLQAKIDDSQKTVTELNSQIKTLENKVSELKLKVDSQKVSKASKELKNLNNTAAEGKKHADKWNYSWSKAFQSFTTYMSVTTVFYQVIHTVKDMINEVTELDGALVELKKVTDLEGESLQRFTKEAYAAGENVAKTGTEMVEAATSFAKAGYNEDQILQLGEVAAMYTNIADEAISSADAADFIIAQLKAFNLESDDLNKTLENSYHIIDAVNEVSNNFAVSSSDIATNLGKASSVMANAGNSMEQMIGLMTAGTEVTRNASKVANGLKTITLRLQGMDDEGEKNLELMSQMEGLFGKLGKTVYNTDGSLKNTYDLLGELADVYPTLTAAEKAYVTETIAGKYQAQNAAAILSNWKTAIDATATALDSQGSAMNENSKYLDSIEGKMANLNSAFEQLASNMINSDFIKDIIDLGTALLQAADSGIGQWVIKGTLLSLTFMALSNGIIKLIDKFSKFKIILGGTANFLKNFNTNIALLTKRNQLLTLSQNIQNQSLKQTKTQMVALGVATTGVNSKKKAQIAINTALAASQSALNLALSAGAMLITGAISLYQLYKQKQEETIQQAISNTTELDAKNSNLDDTISKIQELRNITDSNTSSYEDTIKAREELMKIQEELRAQYGKEADSINVVTDSISDQIVELKKLKQEQAQDYLDDNEDAYKKAKKKVNKKHQVEGDEIVGKYNSVGRSLLYMGIKKDYSVPKEYSGVKNAEKEYLHSSKMLIRNDTYDNLSKELTDAANYLKENREAIAEMYDVKIENIDKEIKKIEDKAKEYANKNQDEKKLISEYDAKLKDAKGYEQFKDELKKMSSQSAITKEDIKKLLEQYPELEAAMKKDGLTIDGLLKSYQNYDDVVDKIGDTLGDEFTKDIESMITANNLSYDSFTKLLEKYPELQTQLDNYGMSISDYTNKIGSLVSKQLEWTTAVKNFNTDIDNLQSAFSALSAAQEEYNESGYISIDTLQTLLDLDDEYLGYLVDENGQLNLNKDAFKNLAQAKINDLIATEEQRHYNAVLAISEQELNNTTKKTIGWFQALWNVIKGGKASVSETTKTLGELEAQINKSGTDAQKAALAAENEKYENRIAVLKATLEGINKNFSGAMGISGSSSSSSKGSSKSEKEWWETALDNLKDQFKYNEITIEEYIRGLDNLLGRVQKGTDAWRKINEELQKQRLTKVEDDYKRGTISLDEYIKKLKELIKAYKQGSDAWNDLADKIKKALQDKADRQKDDLATAEDAAVGIIDEEIDKLKKLKEEKEDYYDKLIADKKAANEETEKELELARLQEALANAQKEKIKRVWREGIGWVWEADQEAIKDAQEALDEFNKEKELDALEKQKDEAIKNLEDQIDAWEKYKESWEDVADDYETQQARITLAQQLGADAEAKILQQRLDVLEDYKSKYQATMKEIEKLENTPSDKLSGYNTPKDTNTTNGNSGSGGSSSSAPSLNKGSYVSVKPGTKWYSNSYGGGNSGTARSGTIKYINNGGSHPYNIDGLGWVKKSDIVGYKNGGMVDYTGLAMLHGTKSKPEFVLNNDQMKSMLSNFIRPQTSSNLPSKNASVTNYNFGNIELPNVSNAKQFVTELKSLVNITKHQ